MLTSMGLRAVQYRGPDGELPRDLTPLPRHPLEGPTTEAEGFDWRAYMAAHGTTAVDPWYFIPLKDRKPKVLDDTDPAALLYSCRVRLDPAQEDHVLFPSPSAWTVHRDGAGPAPRLGVPLINLSTTDDGATPLHAAVAANDPDMVVPGT